MLIEEELRIDNREFTMKRITTLYLFVFVHLCSLSAQDSLLLRNYNFVKQYDPWFTNSNGSALTRFTAPDIAEAEMSLTRQKGGLANYYDSPNATQANVYIEAIHRLNQRTVVSGGISYNYFSGKKMTGSTFINPERKPFDINESTLDHPGKKHRDTYQLNGTIGVDVWKGYAVGASFKYTAANYAKYKDLRHKNKLMDMSLSAGIYAPIAEWLNVGANYTYHRNTESLSFKIYGTNENIYRSLINYGAFMGQLEQFGGDGYTDKSREIPLFENRHGGSLQIEIRPTEQLLVYGSIDYSKGDGYYGRRSPYTVSYTQHERNIKDASFSITYQPLTRLTRHHLDFSFSNEKLANRAEVFRELANSSGAYYYEYYDPVETGDKQWQDLHIGYTAQLGIKGEIPTWQFTATWQWGKQDQLAYLYPYYRQQAICFYELSAGAERNILLKHGVLTFSLDGAFRKGSGAPYEDGIFITPDSKQTTPTTMNSFLLREYQFLTAPQYAIGGNAKYAFIFPGTRLKTHIRLALSHRKANTTYDDCIGRDRTQSTFAIGCTF